MIENIRYQILKNKCEFIIDNRIYSIGSLMKTAYKFIDDIYILLQYEDAYNIKIIFRKKYQSNNINFKVLVGEFVNELLHQSIRQTISSDTKNIREIILARALYGTVLDECDVDKCEEIKDENDLGYIEDSNVIAMSWQDKYCKDVQKNEV